MKEIKKYVFSVRLKEIREDKKLTQKELAAKLSNTNVTTLSKYENIKNDIEDSNSLWFPTLVKAYEIVKELGCSLDYYLMLNN